MKAIELVPVSATRQQVREVNVLGYIEYQPGRQYPWLGCHGGVCQYFEYKSEAVQYASTGVE